MKKFGLPKVWVNSNHHEIKNLFLNGKRIYSQSFDLLYSQKEKKFKVLFAASKQFQTHVQKNRAKRLLREIFRLNQDLLPHEKSIALIAKPKILQQDFKQLVDEYSASIKSIFD